MTRVLFFGDLAGTGFGTVTMDLGAALLARGEDVRFVSNWGTPADDLPEPFASRTALVSAADETAFRIAHLAEGALFEDRWAPDVLIILGDVGSLKMSGLPSMLPEGMPAFHYVPIEGVGLPPRWALVWRRLMPVTTSEFGAAEIAKVIRVRPPVVYHGVDTEAFYPVSRDRPIVMRGAKTLTVLRSKAECKAFFGGKPEDVWLFRADRNMPRKNYPSLLRALAPVLARYPKARLVWHCLTLDQGGDLEDERSKYPEPIARRMQSTGLHDRFGGVDRRILNALYNAADIYVSVSAEGFGLTIAEAMAAGVPAVGMDYSSVPEVIGPGGLLAPVAGLTDNIYSHFWALVDEAAFGRAVEALLTDAMRRREIGEKGRRHVVESFTWARAAEQFSALCAPFARKEVAA